MTKPEHTELDNLNERVSKIIQKNKATLDVVERMESMQKYRNLTYESTHGIPMIR